MTAPSRKPSLGASWLTASQGRQIIKERIERARDPRRALGHR